MNRHPANMPPMPSRMASPFGLGILCAIWLVAVVAGSGMIFKYQNQPGLVGTTPESWPQGTIFALDRQRDTLIMFAHPRCPCTRASLAELNRLMSRSGDRVTAHVAFLSPHEMDADWAKTDRWTSAEAISGVSVMADADGALARQFGAETSGYVVLYNPQGKLLFKGGITASRSHEGDNAGESAILAMVLGKHTDLKLTPVFGCSLLDKCKVSQRTAPEPQLTEGAVR